MIKQATRACYGLFRSACCWSLSGSWPRAAKSRPFTASAITVTVPRPALSPEQRPPFPASYDEFWQSIDGPAGKPLALAATAMSGKKIAGSIASKKRAEYRRRFQLLDQLTEQVAILTQRHAGD
ncbi:VirK/YbjX family protein [Klebsiella pneumoniae subsp. pneumoniae]|nr:VirK/YbjX family protein [Klebsiella pneumoniae subsp. pneumoniae]